MDSITKKCTKCGETKVFSEFNKEKKGKYGIRNICRKCHNAENKKWISENRDKNNIAKRKYYYAHHERVLAARKDYGLRNAELVRERNKLSNKKNRVKRRETERKYREKNPGYIVKKRHNRRARLRNTEGQITSKEWKDLCDFYGNKCLRCGNSGAKLTLDHVVSLKLGGKNTIDNVQPLCLSCNSVKGAKHIDYRIIIFRG